MMATLLVYAGFSVLGPTFDGRIHHAAQSQHIVTQLFQPLIKSGPNIYARFPHQGTTN